MKRLWSLMTFVLALPLVAVESQPALQPAEREAIGQLFAHLQEAFLSGNHRIVRSLLVAHTDAEEVQLENLAEAVRTEFKRRSYSVFEVREWNIDETLGSARLDVWVHLYTVCSSSDENRHFENFHNDAFLLERQPDGSYLIVDSPFFLTLGLQQGVGLIADALLVAIGCLVGLVFWVWMGFEAFTLRPRRPVWRTSVMLVPLLGALVFFVLVYLPGLVRRPEARAGAET